MAMILDAFVSKCFTLLTDFVQEEVVMLLGVKDELQKLRERMRSIQSLLEDAEKRKFYESSIDLWLSELKDVMYDADDIIDRCRIEGAQLLADQTPKSTSATSPVCCNFSSAFSCFTNVTLRHEIGNRIKELNDRLDRIYENRKRFKLHKSKTSETTQVDTRRQTSSLIDPLVVGREVEDDANKLVDLLVGEKVEEKCRLFAVVGMGGIGKTTLAQKIFNHQKIQDYFNLKGWACVSQTYSETDLLKLVIREAKGNYGDANTKSELLVCLRDSVVSGQSLFLVLDDVWGADVWVDLLRIPLYDAKTSVRVLVTTRSEIVATDMKAAHIHSVMKLSIESSWDMLRRRLFSDEEEELANDLKELGIKIVENCKGLPLAIKVIGGVLFRKERTMKVWDNFLNNDAWSISKLPEELRGALYLSFEDLPSHLKQCFLYFSLYPEDAKLFRDDFTRLWVAEGFVTEQQDSIMEDLAEKYFNELLKRNLLVPDPSNTFDKPCTMHDLVRSLALYLAKEETSFGDINLRNSSASNKLRRLSVVNQKVATTEILDSIAKQGALRTLHASNSNLLLNDERLKQLSHLRVLDIRQTKITILPNSIENLVHLRYLNLSYTWISAIPESIEHLANLQFLILISCPRLTQLPSEITRLHNLRHLDLSFTPLSFIPKGIGKLQHLNTLFAFVAANNDFSSKLEELNSLKQIRKLTIWELKSVQSGAIILKKLCFLSDLVLVFSHSSVGASEEEQLTVEKLFDQLIPPQSLEKLNIQYFFGGRFPNWMMPSSSFEKSFPLLTILDFNTITSCTELPPLGQLPQLKKLKIIKLSKVKKIGPEFLGVGMNSTMRIAFPKLEEFYISRMDQLEEWYFGAQVEQNASPRFKLLPYLQKLDINACPLLKQLPQGLKYSAMKSLSISNMDSLKSVEELPKIEVLEINHNENLKKVCCLPALKQFEVSNCMALSCVEKLDALQELEFCNYLWESLPKWLLTLLQQRGLQKLNLKCSKEAFRECVKEGSHWDLIQHIPQVTAKDLYRHHLRYTKQPYVYDTNL